MKHFSFEVADLQYEVENIVYDVKGIAFFAIRVLKDDVQLWDGKASVGPRASENKFRETAIAAYTASTRKST